MIQTIEEEPSFGQLLARGGGQASGNFINALLGQHMQNKASSKENAALKLMGIDLEGVNSPEMRKTLVQETLKRQGVGAKQMQKEQEKAEKGQTFNKILDKMEGLKPYAGNTKIPGLKSFGGQFGWTNAGKKRAQINTLRLSLEGLFRDLTLKGQFPKAIYERILNELPNADDPEKKYQGKIDAIKDILEAHFGGREESAKSSSKKERPPLESFIKGA